MNSTLQTLRLSSNNLGETAAQAIFKALKVNSTLQTLDLSQNNLGETAGQVIGEALKKNSALQWLYLQGNDLGDTGGQAIGEALKVKSTLQTLHLQANRLGETAGQTIMIGEALKVKIRLFDCVGSAAVKALKVNSTLHIFVIFQYIVDQAGSLGGREVAEGGLQFIPPGVR